MITMRIVAPNIGRFPGRRAKFVALALILSALLLTGCQLADARSERVVADWSRGERLGKAAINGRTGLAVEASGENLYTVWITEHEPNGTEFLHFSQLDHTGRVVVERDLSIGVDRPTQVEIALDHRDNLHLTWIDRLAGVRRLFYARLDKEGRLGSYPKPISPPEVTVTSYALELNPDGDIDIFWGAKEGKGAGLYHTRLDSWGDIMAENLDLRRGAFNPTFRVTQGLATEGRTDDKGIIHLAWQEEPDYSSHLVYYATFDPTDRTLGTPFEIASFPAPTGTIARRPSLGLAKDDVYIFWSLERRGGGLAPPSANSYYVAFPSGRPDMAGKPRPVQIPALNTPQYERTKSPFNVHELASHTDSPFPSQFVYMPWSNRGHHDELPVAFAVQLASRTKSTIQIALTLWADGEMKGYQVVGKTRNSSLKPVLQADAQNDFHLIWIDTAGFGVFDVYYASTAESVRHHLNRITAQDIMATVFDVLWALVQGLSFIPMAITWTFMPLALIAIYLFIRAEGDLARTGSRIMLVASILLYTGFKFLFRPGWLTALPLPGQLSSDIANLMIYAMPLVIAGLSGVLTWLYISKREFASLLPAFGVFAGCDAIITLLIYVPGVLGE